MQFLLKYAVYKDIAENKVSSEVQKKIIDLVSNIFVYKFPPVLNWPEGVSVDIPVDYVIAIRKMLENSSKIVVNNINELCFSKNSGYSSYGNKIIIIPIEYITGEDEKQLFLDVFAHELGHALAYSLLKNKSIDSQVQKWHGIIKHSKLKDNDSLFFSPLSSKNNLSKYQFEDYKEFFSECFSQILNHYKDLMKFVFNIPHKKASISYLMFINLLLNYVLPFSKEEKIELIEKF